MRTKYTGWTGNPSIKWKSRLLKHTHKSKSNPSSFLKDKRLGYKTWPQLENGRIFCKAEAALGVPSVCGFVELSLALLWRGRCPSLSGKPNQTFLNVVCLPFYLDFSQIHAFIPWIELSFHSEIRSEKKYLQWVAEILLEQTRMLFFSFFSWI